MSDRHDDRPSVEDVFENGFLRACLQDYRDDSFRICNTAPWTLAEENEYFRDLLNWEAAPVKRVADLLPPNFELVDAAKASDAEISDVLDRLVKILRDCNQILIYTDHLSDRALYTLIVKQVLPCKVKYMQTPKYPSYWNFCYFSNDDIVLPRKDDETWVVYYASDAQRLEWSRKTGAPAPPKRSPLFHRDDPQLLRQLAFH